MTPAPTVTVLDRNHHLFPSTEQRLNDKLDNVYTAALEESAGNGQVIDLGRWSASLAACSRPRRF